MRRLSLFFSLWIIFASQIILCQQQSHTLGNDQNENQNSITYCNHTTENTFDYVYSLFDYYITGRVSNYTKECNDDILETKSSEIIHEQNGIFVDRYEEVMTRLTELSKKVDELKIRNKHLLSNMCLGFSVLGIAVVGLSLTLILVKK